jgi:hypothetical protein
LAKEVGGTLGATIMFSIIASVFMGIWLWTVPRDYQLPDNLTHHVRRLTDDGVCQVKIGPSGVKLSHDCDD